MNDLNGWLMTSARHMPPNGRANTWLWPIACICALALLVIGCNAGWI